MKNRSSYLKNQSADAVMDALVREAPLVLEWISSTDLNPTSVARGKQLQALLDAARRPYIDALGE